MPALVAGGAWLGARRSTAWDDTLWVALYPILAGASPATAEYVDGLDAETLRPIEAFFAREAARHVEIEQPRVRHGTAARPGPFWRGRGAERRVTMGGPSGAGGAERAGAEMSGERIVELAYGRGVLAVRIPAGCEVTEIRKRALPVIADPGAAVAEALARPVGCAPLAELARGRRSACILICDVTRPVPNGLVLPALIRTLLEAGIPAAAITVLVATGLHRPNEGAELEELVGSRWVLDTVTVANHFACNDAEHADLGATSRRATPVRLDRRFVEADLRIATGLVEPHFMAGYSGGRKVVAPGIAGEETIRTFHSARFMEDPGAVQCNLEGNPLHEEQLEICAMLGEVLAVNTVIDEERRLAFVNFGEIAASHLGAVELVAGACAVPVARRFATVLTSAAGHPLDRTYYQTVKGMVTPIEILAPGADLIIASSCAEGLGSEAYRAAQRRLVDQGPEGFLTGLLDKPLAEVDEWQSEMQLKPMRVASIRLYAPELPAADRGLTGVTLIDSIEEAVAASLARGGEPALAVIPEGPYVIPRLAGAA